MQRYAESTTTFVFYANTSLNIALSPIKSYRILCLDYENFHPVVGVTVALNSSAGIRLTNESGITVWG